MNYATQNISALECGVPNVDTAEIVVPQASTLRKFYFDQNVKLENVEIIGCSIVQGTGSNTSLSGNVIATQGQLADCYLTLATKNGVEVISGLQAQQLIRSNADGRIFPLQICGVYWQKSYIEFTGLAAAWTAPTSIFLQVFHTGKPQPEGIAGRY